MFKILGGQKRIKMGDRDGVKLFVYGINANCPKDLLEETFKKCGKVNDIFNTGKGYAFVTMADERDAKTACEDLNGTELDGQDIKSVPIMILTIIQLARINPKRSRPDSIPTTPVPPTSMKERTATL